MSRNFQKSVGKSTPLFRKYFTRESIVNPGPHKYFNREIDAPFLFSSYKNRHRMEFPEDIRRIISEFSRPYFKEYKRALRVHKLTEWPNLKAALTNEVLAALLHYQLT
jgi:hypothetical protein